MRSRIKVEPKSTKFQRVYEMPFGNFTIERGDLIKIQGEWGMRFKFDSVTTNTETGAQWVDCFEVYKQQAGCFRAFSLDRVKRIPKRRARSAKRRTATPTS